MESCIDAQQVPNVQRSNDDDQRAQHIHSLLELFPGAVADAIDAFVRQEYQADGPQNGSDDGERNHCAQRLRFQLMNSRRTSSISCQLML